MFGCAARVLDKTSITDELAGKNSDPRLSLPITHFPPPRLYYEIRQSFIKSSNLSHRLIIQNHELINSIDQVSIPKQGLSPHHDIFYTPEKLVFYTMAMFSLPALNVFKKDFVLWGKNYRSSN